MRRKTGLAIITLTAVALAVLCVLLYRSTRHPTLSRPAPSPPSKQIPGVQTSHDPCLLPGPAPVMPQGSVATEADMQTGHDRVQGFVLQLEAYQACRNSQIDHAGATITEQQKGLWIDEGNAAVDEANTLAAAYSAQLAAYKRQIARHSPDAHGK